MIGVVVTFHYGDNFDEPTVRKIAEIARVRFEGMPGLRSKTFTLNSGKREAVNFYVWDAEEAAKEFFTDELLERVAGLYGVRPSIEFVQIVALVENTRPCPRPAHERLLWSSASGCFGSIAVIRDSLLTANSGRSWSQRKLPVSGRSRYRQFGVLTPSTSAHGGDRAGQRRGRDGKRATPNAARGGAVRGVMPQRFRT